MRQSIRIANSNDVVGILSIYSYYILNTTYTFEYEVPTLPAFMARFEMITSKYPWIVYEDNGEIRGYAYASVAFERAAYQWDVDVAIYVDHTYTHRGIGKELYRRLFLFLKQLGIYNLYAIITEINAPSIAFHRELGFQDIGVFHKSGYKFAEWHDVLWMEKHIGCFDKKPQTPLIMSDLDSKMISEIMS